jgi:hypothetical protein
VTIQLSKTLYMSVVETHPRMRPRKIMIMSEDKIVQQEREYVIQKNRQAIR